MVKSLRKMDNWLTLLPINYMLRLTVILVLLLCLSPSGSVFAADASAPPAGKPSVPTAETKASDSAAAKSSSDSAGAKQPAPAAKSSDESVVKPVVKSATKSGDSKLTAVSGFIGNASKRAAAVATGFAVGVPVAAVRVFLDADVEQAKSIPFIGESENRAAVWVSRFMVIPSSVFSGTVQAPLYSGVNAWRESEDRPFSKESFFFGDLDERMGAP